ncbi:MAG: L,D-transpeptidase [Acidimicrobiales bacterium]
MRTSFSRNFQVITRVSASVAVALALIGVTVAAWPGAIDSEAAGSEAAPAVSTGPTANQAPSPLSGVGTMTAHVLAAGLGPNLDWSGLAGRIAPVPPPPPPGLALNGWIITARGPLATYSSPGSAVAKTLPAANPFSNPTTLAVVGVPQGDWAQVVLPQRPNDSTAWVHTPDATVSWTPYRIDVSRANRRLTVSDAGRVVFTTPVSVGTNRDPTPAGQTFLYELIKLPTSTGPYGPWIFGLAFYSNAIQYWSGLIAQIGIHGNDEPGGIGHAVSHGCIRLPNTAITTLVGMLPLGTPVNVA